MNLILSLCFIYFCIMPTKVLSKIYLADINPESNLVDNQQEDGHCKGNRGPQAIIRNKQYKGLCKVWIYCNGGGCIDIDAVSYNCNKEVGPVYDSIQQQKVQEICGGKVNCTLDINHDTIPVKGCDNYSPLLMTTNIKFVCKGGLTGNQETHKWFGSQCQGGE